MNQYAQINGAGMCVGQLESTGTTADPKMIPIAAGENRLGQRWTGSAWEVVAKTTAQEAAEKLAKIDADTGMGRSMREAIIAIADKVGANLAHLKAKEAEAAAERIKL